MTAFFYLKSLTTIEQGELNLRNEECPLVRHSGYTSMLMLGPYKIISTSVSSSFGMINAGSSCLTLPSAASKTKRNPTPTTIHCPSKEINKPTTLPTTDTMARWQEGSARHLLFITQLSDISRIVSIITMSKGSQVAAAGHLYRTAILISDGSELQSNGTHQNNC